MPQLIPTSQELTNYQQTTTLDGRDYVLRFFWNQREGKWFVSIFDAADAPIAQSIKLVVQVPLLRGLADERRPPGILIAVDTTAPETDYSAEQKSVAMDAGLTELGERVLLLYFPADEVAALASS